MENRERPMLYSTPMVVAVLDGRKTKTRRVQGLEQINEIPDNWKPYSGDFYIDENGRLCQKFYNTIGSYSTHVRCPYGQPGDILWVRETFWNSVHDWDWSEVIYRASEPGTPISGWKPSIFMPKAAARIWLQITDIRVDHLQDIAADDAIAEGIEKEEWTWGPTAFPDGTIDKSLVGLKTTFYRDYRVKRKTWRSITPQESFCTLWVCINGTGSWLANPWVWVIAFKVLSTTGRPANLVGKEVRHA